MRVTDSMSRFVRGLSLLALCASVASCAATAQFNEPLDPLMGVNTYLGSRDIVWAACVRVVTEQGYQIGVVEKESGLLTTQLATFTSGLGTTDQIKRVAKLPPGTILSVWDAGRYSVNVLVTPVTDSTTMVRITPHIEAFERNVSRAWCVCESNGAIEGRMLRRISELVDRPR